MPQRICIIDDDPYIVEVLENCLWREGYETIAYSNPHDARKNKAHQSADLILCDRNLPEEDGVDFVYDLRHNGIQTPVIIMSIKGDADEVIEGFEKGADDYLIKPFSLKELLLRIRAILSRKPVHDQAIMPSRPIP